MGDGFTYKAYNGSTYSAATSVSISFMGMSQPQASGDTYSMTHDHTLSVSAAGGVLANDSDPNHIHLTSVLHTSPSHGSVSLNSDGSFSYTPAAHFAGSDSFTYEAYDGNQYSSPAMAMIYVNNTAPMASNDNYSLLNSGVFNVTASAGVLANDTDADGDTLTATSAMRSSWV